MKVETFQYSKDKGWSIPAFPKLDSRNTLVLVFASPQFISNPEPIKELAKHYPQSIIIGCSSAGEIAGAYLNDKSIAAARILDDSLSVAVTSFEGTKIKSALVGIDESSESYEVGKKIAESLDENDLRGIFVLSEGLQVNGSELVRGLNAINKNIVITGGLAGDGSKFQQTWTIYNGEIKTNLAIGVGLYGDKIKIAHGSRGGWDIFGPERKITKSKNNILYELDGRPALELYKEYLGDRASGLPATGLLFPLAIRKDSSDDKPLVRTILGINEQDQSLVFAGDVPMGHLAQLMHANFDRLITGATEAGESALETIMRQDLADTPILAVAISCVGRRLLLGERTEEEVESMLQVLPKETKLVGFYSYGELSPFASGKCDFHNQTMTLTTFSEN